MVSKHSIPSEQSDLDIDSFKYLHKFYVSFLELISFKFLVYLLRFYLRNFYLF